MIGNRENKERYKGFNLCLMNYEYVALSEAVSEVKFELELMKNFNAKLNDPVKIFEDNAGAINIVNYYHYVHESMKKIEIIKID